MILTRAHGRVDVRAPGHGPLGEGEAVVLAGAHQRGPTWQAGSEDMCTHGGLGFFLGGGGGEGEGVETKFLHIFLTIMFVNKG